MRMIWDEERVLQPTWDYMLDKYGDVLASQAFQVVMPVSVYFLFCLPFTVLDLLHVKKFKIQKDKDVTNEDMIKVLKLTLWHHFLYILPVSILSILFAPPLPLPKIAPPLFFSLIQLIICLILFDFLYFSWHYLFHKVKPFFNVVHSIHHQYYTPFSFVTQYVHPIELFFTGFFSLVTPIILQCHPLVTWVWTILSIYVSVDAHCGYDFPFSLHRWVPFYGGALTHDMHHQRPTSNYEPFFTYLDQLLGTAHDPRVYQKKKDC